MPSRSARILVLAGAALAATLAACQRGERSGPDTSVSNTGAVGDPTPGAPAVSAAAPDTAAAGAAPGDAAALQASVDSVARLAEGGQGLIAVPPTAALALIERIEPQLKNSGNDRLREIGDDLEKLRGELGPGSRDGVDKGDVAEIFERLGPRVTAVAATAPAPLRGSLERLGASITRSGRQLGGGGNF